MRKGGGIYIIIGVLLVFLVVDVGVATWLLTPPLKRQYVVQPGETLSDIASRYRVHEPTLRQETGVVIDVDSPALGQVDSFELLTADGETVVFDTRELRFRPEFPASHLMEHRVIGDQIVVTYKQDGERLVVTQLDDQAH